MASETALASQRVVPSALEERGYPFLERRLEGALNRAARELKAMEEAMLKELTSSELHLAETEETASSYSQSIKKLTHELESERRRADDLADEERRQRRALEVGLVFQEFELLDYLSGLDNVLLPHRLAGAGRERMAAARARAEHLAGTLGIEEVLGRVPRRMSQGQRQRVAIGRALVTEPSLVLCDEPTGNLDPTTADDVLTLLLAEARGRGAALLMVTHDHSLLERFDRVVDVRELGSAEAGA